MTSASPPLSRAYAAIVPTPPLPTRSTLDLVEELMAVRIETGGLF